MMDAYSLVIVKPDAVEKKLTGHILTALLQNNVRIIAAKCLRVSEDLAKKHYAAHEGKHFFDELLGYITGKQHRGREVMALVCAGENVIQRIRELAGATNPEEAVPGSLRGSLGRIRTDGTYENVIHASANSAEAEQEIKLWFSPDEIIEELFPSEEVERTVRQNLWS